VRAASRTSPAPSGDGAITALTVRKGRSDRIAVYLDGAFALELAAVLVDQAGLRRGDLLTAEAQDRLVEEDAPYRARSRSLRLLALRDRSRGEVESRLQTVGFEPEVIASTISWLQGLGYLDDGRFATNYAADRLRAGWGERRVRAELRRKGLDQGLIEAALGPEGVNAQAAAEGADSLLATARRRFGAQFVSDPERAERRLTGFLVRRGYDWGTVGRVARALRLEAGAGLDVDPDVGLEADPGTGPEGDSGAGPETGPVA
jgi:regulatory protein